MIRRYSDFEWLSSELVKQYPGTIVPPLPEKQAVGNLSNEFVESRRRALEKFLVRVAIHPDLGYSTFFVSFLQKGWSLVYYFVSIVTSTIITFIFIITTSGEAPLI